MLEHLRQVEQRGGVQPVGTDLATQDESLVHFRKVLEDLESVFGRLNNGLATLNAHVAELSREKNALPIQHTTRKQPHRSLAGQSTHGQRYAARLAHRPAVRLPQA